MNKQRTLNSRYEARERWSKASARLVIGLASGKTQVIVFMVTILFTLWQLYVFAWQPLSAPANLPAGLASVRAQLDTESLAKIQEARSERLQHSPNLFSDADQYFVLSPLVAR